MAERFIAAAKDGNMDILRTATKKDLNRDDEDGMSATMWAAQNGNLEALRMILGREGDPNKCDILGSTSLHHAAMRGHLDVVSFLVNWGCNIYSRDNDMHTAQDVASLHNQDDIIRFLDTALDQKRTRNPKHAVRQNEEAIRAAESNQKKYEKMQEVAAKRAEKEQKKVEKSAGGTYRPKKSFFQTLTLRGKNKADRTRPTPGQTNFSHMAGLTAARNVKGKIQNRHSKDSPYSENREDFKVSERDSEGNRTWRSISNGQGIHGTISGVMYMNAKNRSSEDDMRVTKRTQASDVFRENQNIYRAKSESDLLDSGIESYYDGEDDDDEENSPSLFNRGEFGKMAFLPRTNMINIIQALPSSGLEDDPKLDDDDFDMDNLTPRPGSEYGSSSEGKLPWNEDDVDVLDENDDNDIPKTKLSAVATFLESNGLIGYLHLFSQEDIELEVLMKMTEKDLQDIKLPKGPLMKLSEAINRRKKILNTPSKMIDTYL